MALKSKKESSLKKSIKRNVRASVKVDREDHVLEDGTPLDHTNRHFPENENVVGMNLGITKNMQDYQSLRVDVWGTEIVGKNETKSDAYARLLHTLDEVLNETVNSYIS